MAKYAISPEGVDSLRNLSKSLDTCVNGFKESNSSLQTLLESLMDELGIYGLEMWNITLKINSTLEDRADDIEYLKNAINQQASNIEELFDFDGSSGGTGGTSSGNGTPSNGSGSSSTNNSVINSLKKSNVAYLDVSNNSKELSSSEITNKLCGGDLTDGSYSSLAFAYAGNKGGCDVIDFRGGDSCTIFSQRSTISEISSFSGVKSFSTSGKDDFQSANSLLDKMESGKEYYLATGQHAAIVKKNGGRIDYLELQHPSDGNGWHLLNDDVLMKRFGCSDHHSVDFSSYLIDVDSLSNCTDFKNLLGYINTNPSEQRKGVSGNVK